MKRQPTGWERIFVNYMFGKEELSSRIYKEFEKHSPRKQINEISQTQNRQVLHILFHEDALKVYLKAESQL